MSLSHEHPSMSPKRGHVLAESSESQGTLTSREVNHGRTLDVVQTDEGSSTTDKQ